MAVAPRGDPRWGEILQLPNLRSQIDVGKKARDEWMARQGELGGAQSMAMSQLSTALQAENDAKMAEIIAADEAKKRGSGGGGRGGGRGGGGGTDPSLYAQYVPPDEQPWPTAPSTAPPPVFNTHLQPSTILGPNAIYRNTLPKTPVGRNRFKPPPQSLAPKAKPPTYKVVLS